MGKAFHVREECPQEQKKIVWKYLDLPEKHCGDQRREKLIFSGESEYWLKFYNLLYCHVDMISQEISYTILI